MTKRNRKKNQEVQDINNFMHEVEEAMHIETMVKFWDSYKVYIVASVAGAFVFVTAWQWYLMTAENGLVNQADSLWVLERTSESNKAESYSSLLNQGSEGYKLVATFKTAEKYLEAGELASATASYDSVINGNESDEFKQLATFYKGTALIASDIKTAETLFKQIVASEGAFVMSAKEMLGIIAEQNGNIAKASKFYENIIVNPAIPQGLRSRVQSRLDFINRNRTKFAS